jgi:hypothetical protein
MATTRKQYSPKFKARVAVEAIRGEKTLNQVELDFVKKKAGMLE